MMNEILAALVIWSLPLLGASCGSAGIQNRQPVEAQAAPTPSQAGVTLTTERPEGFFALDSSLLNNPPEMLEVSVTKVINSAATPVNIFVYLSSGAEKKTPEADRILLGNFNLYPVDRPGKFLLDPSEAFRKFSESRKDARELRLVFRMETPADKKPPGPVEIVISEPNWKR